jgi:hypothetical protein
MPGTALPTGDPTVVGPGAESQRAAIVQAAASKWGIPASTLWGVYSVETGAGQDVKTSSTGAEGSFQFEPGTAATYNYPLTNATDLKTFAAQANGAAHYLSDLFAQTGSWDQAISDYNAGPAGPYQPKYVASVQSDGSGFKATQLSSSTWGAIAAVLGIVAPVAAGAGAFDAVVGALGLGGASDAAAGDAAGGAAAGGAAGGAGGYALKGLSDLSSLAKAGGIAALLVDPSFLFRALKVVGGLVLAYFALRQFAAAGGARA